MYDRINTNEDFWYSDLLFKVDTDFERILEKQFQQPVQQNCHSYNKQVKIVTLEANPAKYLSC